jgi:Phage tail tube protein
MGDAYNTMLLKKETVYSTDAAPTAALNGFLTRNLKLKPIESDRLERNLDLPARGARAVAITNRRQSATFELELAGSGTAGTAAPWMEALEICGMEAPVLTALTKAEQKFALLGAVLSSATIHSYRGSNQRRRMVGARADISAINFTAGAYPFIGLSAVGLLGATPFDQSALTVADISRWKKPVEVNTTNTLFTLDGYAAIMRSFVLQADAEIVFRNLVGSNYVRRGNHALKGKIVIEAPDFSAKNYFATLLAETLVAVQIIHGTVAGNIVKLNAANLQIVDISDGEEGDVSMFEIDVILTISAGQDDILITAQ